MSNYTKQTWKDAVVDDQGKIIEAGTLITKERMEHIEQAIVDKEADITQLNQSLSTEITNRQNEDAKKLPLTGGTLMGDFNQVNSTQVVKAKLNTNADNTNLCIGNNVSDSTFYQNCRYISLQKSPALNASVLIYEHVNGTSTGYKIYGEHNITVSTCAPSTTLAEGAQHQVYA